MAERPIPPGDGSAYSQRHGKWHREKCAPPGAVGGAIVHANTACRGDSCLTIRHEGRPIPKAVFWTHGCVSDPLGEFRHRAIGLRGSLPERVGVWGLREAPGEMTKTAIEQMSWEEKLRALEKLWEAITREDDRFESPDWHREALNETRQRVESELEEPIDWATAKHKLRD